MEGFVVLPSREMQGSTRSIPIFLMPLKNSNISILLWATGPYNCSPRIIYFPLFQLKFLEINKTFSFIGEIQGMFSVNITVEFVMASANVKSTVEHPRFTIRNIFKAWKIWIEYLCFHIKNYTTGTGFLILKINYKNNHHFIIMLEKENINKI